jgi:hypothetical protein
MPELALVMPLATPQADLLGRPCFWWATESVRLAAPLGQIVFVVHEVPAADRVDARLRAHYPHATIVTVPAASDAMTMTEAGVRALTAEGPFAVSDGSEAFETTGLQRIVQTLDAPEAVAIEGALLGFRADDPRHSYVRLDPYGMVAATVERQVASPFAIAACHLFASPPAFLALLEREAARLEHAARPLNGIVDMMIRDGGRVAFLPLAGHVAFGIPDEAARLTASDLGALGLS